MGRVTSDENYSPARTKSIDVDEAARIIGIPVDKLRRLVAEHKVTAKRVGKTALAFTAHDIAEAIAARATL